MIKILLVDDHELFRTGLRTILASEPDIEILAEVDSGEKAVEFVRETPPDIVLMDLHMPGIGGLEATRKIRHIDEKVHIIVVTALSDEPFPGQLLDAGARGYISKSCPAQELFEAIHTVSRGRHFLAHDVAQRLSLLRLKKDGAPSALSLMTAREMQIMMMIINGQGTQDIADSLFISPKTISTYRRRIYEKLGVNNDVELTHYALRHGLLDQTV